MSFFKILLASYAFLHVLNLHAENSAYGLLMVVKGQVIVSRPSQSENNENKIDAKVGLKVFPEDTIVTGKDSRAKIVMSDRNIINVLPETKIKIEKYTSGVKEKNVRISLYQGSVRSNVEQKYDADQNKFEVKTPTAVAGVRGTQFITKYEKEKNATTVVTLRGEVTFQGLNPISNKFTESISIKRGETATNQDGRKPDSPIKMSPAEINRVEHETAVRKDTSKSPNVAIAQPTKNAIRQIIGSNERNDNLLGDTSKNIINKPARVQVIIEQTP